MNINDFVFGKYEQWIHDQLGSGTHWNLEQAWSEIQPDLVEAVRDGIIEIDTLDAGWKALRAADTSIIGRGKSALRKEHRRGGQRSIDNGLWLNALIPLGKNERILFGDIGYDEYTCTINLHADNVAAADRGMRRWTNLLAPFVTYFSQGHTVRQVVTAGHITEDDLDWGTDAEDD